jgi:glyoxylase-like metal-dependent hydrolase (beta-lactamase superfamily II)
LLRLFHQPKTMEQLTQHHPIPAVLQWKVGQKLLTVINDSFFQLAEAYLTNLPAGGAGQQLRQAFRPSPPVLTTNVFLLQSAEHPPLLIDAGMGTKMAPAINGQLHHALAFLGLTPEDIGLVLLTHLHGDHYYGLLDSQGKKSFPNAKVWVADTETAYWLENEQLNEQDQQNAVDVRLALQPYERLHVAGREIVPGITTVPLPGHTPGQTGFLVQSEGEELLFCADILSLPAIQAATPTVGFATDTDHELAVQTRVSTLQRAADQRLLLAGPHFEYPCLHYVESDNAGGFRLIPEQWLAPVSL